MVAGTAGFEPATDGAFISRLLCLTELRSPEGKPPVVSQRLTAMGHSKPKTYWNGDIKGCWELSE